jgi:hypothetical protein
MTPTIKTIGPRPFSSSFNTSIPPDPFLSARLQPHDQGLGRTHKFHGFLYRHDIVRYSPKFDHPVIQVRNSEGRPRVTVPWLADRSWIEQVTRAGLNPQCREVRARMRPEVNQLELVVTVGKPALMVRMAKECNGARRGE